MPSSAEVDMGSAQPTDISGTLSYSVWNPDQAVLLEDVIAAFNEEYPNITVNSSFLAFPEFWEKRQTEAAGGNLPDVPWITTRSVLEAPPAPRSTGTGGP